MKRPGYKEAIDWIASNDDCYWLGDYDAHGPIISVSAALVRDLWDVSDEKIIADLRRALKRIYPDHPANTGEKVSVKALPDGTLDI